jgi:FkbH-like protein
MSERRLTGLVIADFNAANLAAYLTHDPTLPRMVVDAVPFGVDGSQALDATGGPDAPRCELAVVWTRPEAVSASLARLAERGEPGLPAILDEVNAFADFVGRLRSRCAHVMVATWQPPRIGRAFGGLSMREGVGLTNAVMRMNLRLAERIDTLPGVTLLDSTAWTAGEHTETDAKLWYTAKIPFRNEVFRRATQAIKSALRASLGESRKLIVVDLDDTLWGGIVGDVGWRHLRLGGHDAVGEAFADFQRSLKALGARGVLLAIASRNDEGVALEAIEQHPEMQLRSSDFSGWRINWQDKAANIASLAGELNLGLSSTVFIDDSPAERGRVREALPEVLVPEWPSRPLLYVDALLGLGCFDAVTITSEDRQRSDQYRAEAERAAGRRAAESETTWLSALGISVRVEELNARNAPRALQLLNKSNQMNLSTRRLGAAELDAWFQDSRRMWTYRVMDRFGDSGLTGVASLQMEGKDAVLVDFVLSCRVFGRRVEETMLHHLTRCAAAMGARQMVAHFRRTSRNTPCLRFLQSSGLQEGAPDSFHWEVSTPYPCPAEVELLDETPAAAL